MANTIHLKGIGVDDDDEVGDEVREHSKTFYCSYGSHDPDAIRLMVHYLYHLDYSATSASDPARSSTPEADSKCHDSDLVMHARVFAVAARYEVTGLRKLAADKFTNAVNASPDHEDFAEAARVVYSTTPKYVRTLRNIVVSKMNRHDDALLNIDHVMEVVKDDSELMFDLLCVSRGLDPCQLDTTLCESRCYSCGAGVPEGSRCPAGCQDSDQEWLA